MVAMKKQYGVALNSREHLEASRARNLKTSEHLWLAFATRTKLFSRYLIHV